MTRSTTAPTVVELFAGAGLLGYAFAAEGYRLTEAFELCPVAARTYARNLGDHVVVGDLTRKSPTVERCDVLLSGPPCQGFSTLGSRNEADPRNRLCLQVERWVRELRPKVVVVENVAAFLESRYFSLLSGRLRRLGYQVSATTLDASDFGVAQRRVRAIVVASRGELPMVPKSILPRRATVREALKGLPRVPDGKNNHYAPLPSPIALARMKVIPPGGDKRDVMLRAPRLAAESWWNTRSEVTDVWGRMLWNEPSNTLRTALLNASKGRYIHPDQNRVVSLREAARLQSIPDEWVFEGTPYQVARQIGNSVPPLLGRAVAQSILETIR